MLAEARKHRVRTRSEGTQEPTGLGDNPLAGVNFLPGTMDGLDSIRAALALSGSMPMGEITSLTVAPRQQQLLSSEPGAGSAVKPVMLQTESVALFKRWVGVADETCRSHPEAGRYWPMPSRPWSGRNVHSRQEFTAEECADIERAGRVYLFGDSALVADYQEAIELYHGNFEAAVYLVDELSVMPSARLVVTGAPAVLVCGKFDLHAPGQLVLLTACQAHFGSLRKFSSAQSLN